MTTHAPHIRRLGAAALALSTLAGVAGCGAGSGTSTRTAAPQSNTSQVAATPDPAQVEVTERIKRLEAARHTRIGAFAIDSGTGRFVGHRADESFPFASTFKAMACGAVLRKARQSAPGLLDKVIHYTKDDLVEYSPSPSSTWTPA